MISTKTHGVLDYVVGIVLIAAPWIFGFATGGPAMWIPVIIGAMSLIYALVTDYELGLVALLPVKAHLAIDVIAGLFLAASPWLFGFAELVYLPHLIVGILMVGAGLFTQKVAGRTAVANRDSRVTPREGHAHRPR